MKTPIRVRDFIVPLLAGCVGAEALFHQSAWKLALLVLAGAVFAIWLWRLRSRFKVGTLLVLLALGTASAQAQQTWLPTKEQTTNNLGLVGAAIIGGAVVIGGGAIYTWLRGTAERLLNPPKPPKTNGPPAGVYPPGPALTNALMHAFALTNAATVYDISQAGVTGPDGLIYNQYLTFVLDYSTNLRDWTPVEVQRWDSPTCTTTSCNGVTTTVDRTNVPLIVVDKPVGAQMFYRLHQ